MLGSLEEERNSLQPVTCNNGVTRHFFEKTNHLGTSQTFYKIQAYSGVYYNSYP